MKGRCFYLINILLCAKLVRSLYNNDSKHSIQGEVIEEFKRLCPNTDMCFRTERANLTERSDFTACCRRCRCDVNCGIVCCPDIPERFLNVSEVNELKKIPDQCVFAQIRKYDDRKLNWKSYRMIGECPANYSNENVKEKCSRQYEDFDFENDDVKTLMPVSAETINVTFRNYYCAICHKALNRQLHFWYVKSMCKNKNNLQLTKLSEIPSKLQEEPLCQVIFEPSFPLSKLPLKVCTGKIDRCNVTGNWKQYDPSIENACLSYTSKYDGYKNIHCYLCNGNAIKETSGICLPVDSTSFHNTILTQLDFYNMISTDVQQKQTNCPSTSVYDPLQVNHI